MYPITIMSLNGLGLARQRFSCAYRVTLQVSKKEEEIRSKTMSQFGGGANDDMQDG